MKGWWNLSAWEKGGVEVRVPNHGGRLIWAEI